MKKELSPYHKLCALDIVSMLRPLWEKQGWRIREDGKLSPKSTSLAIETPWHHTNKAWFLDCNIWNRVIFDLISRAKILGNIFVPKGCQNCWKVVVRPQTLKQLFTLEKIQKDLGRPSKCGIELRKYVFGLYGGYFYNRSKEQGLECYGIVRDIINKHPDMGEDVPVILKRACTEMEMACGDSSKWEILPDQDRLEDLITQFVVIDAQEIEQPQIVINYLHRKWIEFAFDNGDKTYKEYTNGESLGPNIKTYHLEGK